MNETCVDREKEQNPEVSSQFKIFLIMKNHKLPLSAADSKFKVATHSHRNLFS